MEAATRALVRRRAGERCEYCLAPQSEDKATFHVEHIVARQHRGDDDPANLALSCVHCNLRKGPNLAGIDTEDGALVPLFNPRRNTWGDHFALRAPLIVGLTPTGRATVDVLAMNDEFQRELRADLIARGVYP